LPLCIRQDTEKSGPLSDLLGVVVVVVVIVIVVVTIAAGVVDPRMIVGRT